ncbi:dihydropteroate synthase-like protein [Stygiolobus azoricus]|uniref:Dihydropteroate synthase-like protein n=1 Tax=Stygiolobus azoricus TaxID=41675 RepID=A0A650CPZ1_9CREN|nr:dihydropteroate synthase-like protein [Stygiolobus azoricus]QGR19911.1 dihydropteroate synthase-like protein [Stygiolobus azoricus]
MKILLVTGKLAFKAVEEVAKKINADVLVLDYPVAALMTTEYIAESLKKFKEKVENFDLIIIPGLSSGDTKTIEEKVGVKAYKGTEDIQDLPFALDLLKKGYELSTVYPADKLIQIERGKNLEDILRSIEESGYYKFEVDNVKIPVVPPPFRIFLEVDATRPCKELEEEVLEKKDFIDILVLGFPNGHNDLDDVRSKVAYLRELIPVAIDSASPEELVEGVKAGASFVFNLNEENMEKLEVIKKGASFVIAPYTTENRAEITLKLYEKAKQKGFEKVILDPVLSPPLYGVVESIIEFKKVREAVKNEPMLMGILNVTELIDADSVGVNALMTTIAGELGVGNLLIMDKGKTRGSALEVKKASQMVSIAMKEHKVPKDLGIDLLILKDKKRGKVNTNSTDLYSPEIVEGHIEPKDMDEGFVKIVKDNKYIYLNWYRKQKFTLIGTDGLSIGRRLLEKTRVNAEHALYIGYELAKAEIALNLGKEYIQDKPLFKPYGYNSVRTERNRKNG